MQNSGIKFMIWNAQSVRSKKLEIFSQISSGDIHVSLISETHLSGGDSFSDPRFRTYRLDRDDGRKGGGVAMIIRKDVTHRPLPCPQTVSIEAMAVEVSLSNQKLVVVSSYFPGSSDPRVLSQYRRDLQTLSGLGSNVVIAGDFNSRHSYWGCARSNAAGTILFQEIMGGDLMLHFPDSPTHFPHSGRTPSTLELVLTKGFPVPVDMVTDQCLSSDHCPVFFHLINDVVSAPTRASLVKDFPNADWRRFSDHIDVTMSRMTHEPLNTDDQIDAAVADLVNVVQEADRLHIPTKPRRDQELRLSPDTLAMIGERRAKIRLWQRTGDPIHRLEVKRLDEKIRKASDEVINSRFSESVSRLNADPGSHRKKFWRIVKMLKKRPRAMPAIRTEGHTLMTAEEKCEAFAAHFRDIHDAASTDRSQALASRISQRIREIDEATVLNEEVPVISLATLKYEVMCLKNGKAPGFDCLMGQHVKHLPDSALLFLAAILNACLLRGYFPLAWKISKVICLCKPGKAADRIASYRPISLLSILGKIFEKIILQHVQEHIEDNDIIIPQQYGFRPGKSCSHQLYRITSFIKRHVAQKKSVGMLALDLSSAFDCVQHDGLLFKMANLGFPKFVLKVVKSFLDHRSLRVSIGNTCSSVQTVAAGVPQGAVLAPTLFNIYMNDIPVPSNVEPAMFADDTAFLTASHRTDTIINRLQAAAKKVEKYFGQWGVKVNGTKTEAILFTRKTAARHAPLRRLRVAGSNVDWKNRIRYLGMVLDKRLTYGDHVQSLIERSELALKSLYPVIGRRSRLNVPNKMLLLKTVYRPTYTYAAPVWYHCAANHRKMLQIHQNRLLKIMLNKPRRFSTERLHSLAKVDKVSDFLTKLHDNFVSGCLRNVNQDVVSLIDTT